MSARGATITQASEHTHFHKNDKVPRSHDLASAISPPFPSTHLRLSLLFHSSAGYSRITTPYSVPRISRRREGLNSGVFWSPISSPPPPSPRHHSTEYHLHSARYGILRRGRSPGGLITRLPVSIASPFYFTHFAPFTGGTRAHSRGPLPLPLPLGWSWHLASLHDVDSFRCEIGSLSTSSREALPVGIIRSRFRQSLTRRSAHA